MNTVDAIKNVTLTRRSSKPSELNYKAEIAFDVSFGKLYYSVCGILSAGPDPSQALILETIAAAAVKELKRAPRQFALVSRHADWEAAGRPPYVDWVRSNYPQYFQELGMR